jgi:hypothetical protein
LFNFLFQEQDMVGNQQVKEPESSMPDAVSQYVEKSKATIANAITSYRQKHPELTEDEITDFAAKVAGRVNSPDRAEKVHAMQTRRSERSRRRYYCVEMSREIGVRFSHHRIKDHPRNENGQLEKVTLPTGGYTTAIRVEGEYAFIAFAFCRDTENFDYLIGREEALKRFVNNQCFRVSLNNMMTVDPVFHLKLIQTYITMVEQKTFPKAENGSYRPVLID